MSYKLSPAVLPSPLDVLRLALSKKLKDNDSKGVESSESEEEDSLALPEGIVQGCC